MVKKYAQEQMAVIENDARIMLVNAFAGAGKTTTLVGYAKARPKARICYIAFNKSVKEEASERFPPNVKCFTTHGLAYSKYGIVYKHKLGELKGQQVSRFPIFAKQHPMDVGIALEIVRAFICSPDERIEMRHAPQRHIDRMKTHAGTIMQIASIIWAKMQDPSDTDFLIPHDGYLKLFQLSRPKLPFDIILLDEFQDSNPVVLSILENQDCRKVFVGDRHQSIYGFRKAVNAMNRVKADSYPTLTNSYRFGNGLGKLATALLHDFKGETSRICGKGADTAFLNTRPETYTMIARSNGVLFNEAVNCLSDRKNFTHVGGVEGYRLDSIIDTVHLFNRNTQLIKDPSIRPFLSYEMMREYAESMDDVELKMFLSVVDRHMKSGGASIAGCPSSGTQRIYWLADKIKQVSKSTDSKEANVLFMTAHKSKGLESDYVVLGDDFTDGILVGEEDFMPPNQEEVNLLYVAMTRAKRGILLNETTNIWLKQRGGINTPQHAMLAKKKDASTPIQDVLF